MFTDADLLMRCLASKSQSLVFLVFGPRIPNNLDSVMPLCRCLVESRKGKMIRKGWSVKERVWGDENKNVRL
jgi:hypothetical protein